MLARTPAARWTAAALGVFALILFTLAGIVPHDAERAFGEPAKGNDDFADAVVIPEPLPYSNEQDTEGATLEVGEPQPPCAPTGRTVWYSYTPGSDATLAAETLGYPFDTVLAVYSGDNLETLTSVGCDNPGAVPAWSEVVFSAKAGETYYLQVGGYAGSAGSLSLNFREVLTKHNDDFADAVAVPEPLPYSNKDKIIGATVEVGEPEPCVPIDSTVWYSFTPSSDVLLRADTNGSEFGGVLAVYTGSSLGTLALVECNNRGGSGGGSLVVFLATAGETYYFQVAAGGNVVFNLATVQPPAKGNDDFAEAVLIPGLSFSNKEDTAGATLEVGEPRPCGSISGAVWYSFTPDSNVELFANTQGSDYHTALAVYTGDSLETLVPIGCVFNEPSNMVRVSFYSFFASAGEIYYFQVGGSYGRRGNQVFNLQQPPEMVLNIKGGDCDDPQRPTTCNVPPGGEFTLSVDAPHVPEQGYVLMQTYIDYGTYDATAGEDGAGPGTCDDGVDNGAGDGTDGLDDDCVIVDLVYQPAPAASGEISWPDCEDAVAVRGAFPELGHLFHGCITGLQPPLPESRFAGKMVDLSFACSADESSTEVRLLPYDEPARRTSGSAFRLPDNSSVIPKVGSLTINCVAPVGGVSLDGGLGGLPAESGGSAGVLLGVVSAMAALAALAGAAWWVRRRSITR